MTIDEANSFVSELEASTGSNLKLAVKQAYIRWAITVELVDAMKTLRYLEEKAGSKGFDIRNRPNLSALRNSYEYLKSRNLTEQPAEYVGSLPPCDFCNRTGIVYVVKAGNVWESAMVQTRQRSAEPPIKWDIMVICNVPCSCEAGDRQAHRYRLSKGSRFWITNHASYFYQADAAEYIRRARGIVLPENGPLSLPSPADLRGTTHRDRNRELERADQAETWA